MVENPNDVRVTLRLPKALHEQIQRMADAEERSLNGQVVWLLRQALAEKGRP